MNTKKILGVVAVLTLVAVAMVGAGAAATSWSDFQTAVSAGGQVTVPSDLGTATSDLSISKDVEFVGAEANAAINLDKYKIVVTGSPIVDFGKDATYNVVVNKDESKSADSDDSIALQVGTGSIIKNLKLVAATGSCTQPMNNGIVQLNGTVTLKNSVLDFSGVTHTDATGTFIGVYLGNTDGAVTIDGCTITNGNSTGHKSQCIVSYKTSGDVVISNSTITTGTSTDGKNSNCIRICAIGDSNKLTVTNSTLTALQTGSYGIALDKSKNSGDLSPCAVSLSTVTFNVNGYEIEKEINKSTDYADGFNLNLTVSNVNTNDGKFGVTQVVTGSPDMDSNKYTVTVSAGTLELDKTSYELVTGQGETWGTNCSISVANGATLLVDDVSLNTLKGNTKISVVDGSKIGSVIDGTVYPATYNGSSYTDGTPYAKSNSSSTEVGYSTALAYTFTIPGKVTLGSSGVNYIYSVTMSTVEKAQTKDVYIRLTGTNGGESSGATVFVAKTSNGAEVEYGITTLYSGISTAEAVALNSDVAGTNNKVLLANTTLTTAQDATVTFLKDNTTGKEAGDYSETLTFTVGVQNHVTS